MKVAPPAPGAGCPPTAAGVGAAPPLPIHTAAPDGARLLLNATCPLSLSAICGLGMLKVRPVGTPPPAGAASPSRATSCTASGEPTQMPPSLPIVTPLPV